MANEEIVAALRGMKNQFKRSSSCLREEDSAYAPVEGVMTVAQLVAHVGLSVDWFIEGMTRPEGFDLNFEEAHRRTCAYTSLAEARKLLDEAFERAAQAFGKLSDFELDQPLPAGPVLGGAPRRVLVGAILDHTAHHRGALTVYSRLLGLTPQMPYGEEED